MIKEKLEINNPNINSLIAYNAESKVVESMRPNGVLIAQVSPGGGIISGKSSVVQFDAWNWEDAALVTDEGLHINWPRAYTSNRRRGPSSDIKYNQKNYEEKIKSLSGFLKESMAYNQVQSKIKHLPFAAMSSLFNNKQTLFIHVEDEKGIIDAVNFSKNFNIDKLVIIGGYQAHLISEFLSKNNVPVLIQHTHSLPNFEDEDYNSRLVPKKVLIDAGKFFLNKQEMHQIFRQEIFHSMLGK